MYRHTEHKVVSSRCLGVVLLIGVPIVFRVRLLLLTFKLRFIVYCKLRFKARQYSIYYLKRSLFVPCTDTLAGL